ncbi:uncharacterized protein LOC117182804 isoform X2 [Belonocnema kinseyi]|uniref:uncharacterized protein LOC117182804 isoform X2 n=1 Tax=Belonocnema kinseyi TaxID=2817044 RepID=UPI00143DEB9E|nr:uncharacterized protein LOC117182804 isoform X2 [Belonocnema kinseyi]
MRTARELIAFFFAIFIGVVAAVPVQFSNGPLERINIPREKLNEMCDIRGDTLYKNILNFDSSLGAHLSFFFEARPNGSLPDEIRWTQERQNECEKDSISTFKLQRLVNTVQLCMNETDRVEYDEDPKFMTRLLKELCKLYSQGGRKIPDVPCIKSTKKQHHVSRRTFVEIDTILLPLIYNTEECSEVRNFFSCLEEGVENNETDIVNEIELARNILFYSLYGCSDPKPFVEAFSLNNVVTNTQFLSRSKRTVQFSSSKSGLKKICEKKGASLLKKFDIAVEEFITVFKKKQLLMSLSADLQNETCSDDTEIRQSFDKLYDAVKDCLVGQDLLYGEEERKKFAESFKVMCYVVDSTLYISSHDKECFTDYGKMLKMSMCEQNSSSVPLTSDVVPQVCKCGSKRSNT